MPSSVPVTCPPLPELPRWIDLQASCGCVNGPETTLALFVQALLRVALLVTPSPTSANLALLDCGPHAISPATASRLNSTAASWAVAQDAGNCASSASSSYRTLRVVITAPELAAAIPLVVASNGSGIPCVAGIWAAPLETSNAHKDKEFPLWIAAAAAALVVACCCCIPLGCLMHRRRKRKLEEAHNRSHSSIATLLAPEVDAADTGATHRSSLPWCILRFPGARRFFDPAKNTKRFGIEEGKEEMIMMRREDIGVEDVLTLMPVPAPGAALPSQRPISADLAQPGAPAFDQSVDDDMVLTAALKNPLAVEACVSAPLGAASGYSVTHKRPHVAPQPSLASAALAPDPFDGL
jgi:hypothetical protein